MSEHELENLLGGFAADTLTPEEKQALYNAALQDQQLFNALADEQALKELLADPVVRRRLLASLKRKDASGGGEHLSWLDWFKRPAGLAVAGGLAAAMFAVVLGTKIYQDSLKHAAPSIATEDTKVGAPPVIPPRASPPAHPSIAERQPIAKENDGPPTDMAKEEALKGKNAQPERSVSPNENGQRTTDVPSDSLERRSGHNEGRTQGEAPVVAIEKTAEEGTASTDQKFASSTAPPVKASASAPMQAAAGTGGNGVVTPKVSARALFYGGEPARQDGRLLAQEKERTMQVPAESAPPPNRLEKKMEQSVLAGKVRGTATELMSLGLRYSFVVRGTDGQDREVDAAKARKSAEPVRLTVEANQDAYLQVWKTVGSSTPQLLLPEKETGQISLKISAGQRWNIPLPTESGLVTLTARVSLFPFGPITRQEAAMFNRLSP
ncbi:MAG: hypothetical protein ABI980_10220, partial [Nitrospirota bacterium]